MRFKIILGLLFMLIMFVFIIVPIIFPDSTPEFVITMKKALTPCFIDGEGEGCEGEGNNEGNANGGGEGGGLGGGGENEGLKEEVSVVEEDSNSLVAVVHLNTDPDLFDAEVFKEDIKQSIIDTTGRVDVEVSVVHVKKTNSIDVTWIVNFPVRTRSDEIGNVLKRLNTKESLQNILHEPVIKTRDVKVMKKDSVKDHINNVATEKNWTCDPTLICANVVSCVDGRVYPTSCGPDNCDLSRGVCGEKTEYSKYCIAEIETRSQEAWVKILNMNANVKAVIGSQRRANIQNIMDYLGDACTKYVDGGFLTKIDVINLIRNYINEIPDDDYSILPVTPPYGITPLPPVEFSSDSDDDLPVETVVVLPPPPPPPPPNLTPPPSNPTQPPPQNDWEREKKEKCGEILQQCLSQAQYSKEKSGCIAYGEGFVAGPYTGHGQRSINRDYNTYDRTYDECNNLCLAIYSNQKNKDDCKKGCRFMHRKKANMYCDRVVW